MNEIQIPLSRLQASEAQTLRLLALVKDMAKVLRTAPVDGTAPLLERAEAIEAGLDTETPWTEQQTSAKAQGDRHEQE